MDRKDMLKLHSLAALVALLGPVKIHDAPSAPSYSPGKCSNCGKDKWHNNAFCSPECCKEFRSKQKVSK